MPEGVWNIRATSGAHITHMDRRPVYAVGHIIPRRLDWLWDTEVSVRGREWVFYMGEEPDLLRDLLARLNA